MNRFVYLIDDDEDFRNSLRQLLATRGNLHIVPYASGDAFMLAQRDHDEGVILLDHHMPGLSGLDMLRQLRDRNVHWPAIMLTGEGDTSIAVRAMKLGALDYLEKPVLAAELFASVDAAFERIRGASEVERFEKTARRRIARLSERERTILTLVVAGLASKEIAAKLGISLRTVEVHRAHVMDKLDASSVAEAVRMAIAARFAPLCAVNT